MTNKAEILNQIARLQQELNQLTKLITSLDETPRENETTIDSIESVVSNDPEDVIAILLQAAQSTDEGERDQLLHTILHSSILHHSPAIDSFLRFSFKTLQGRWQEYLQDHSDFYSFTISRQQRNDRGELSDLRLYLSATHRSPCPVTLQQDPNADLAWKIVSSSL